MSWLDPAWSEAGVRILKDMLSVSKEVRKEMIEFLVEEGLWSEEDKWSSHEARWNGNCNPDKNMFWKVAELWALSKRFNRHHLFLAMAEDLGYEVRRKSSTERNQELLERLTVAIETLNSAILPALGEITRPEPDKKPPRPGLHFSLPTDRVTF